MTNYSPMEFNRSAVEPIACLQAGWHLIRDQYWLFVGITFVGLLVGSLVPFGIIMGPMMCGIYLALFRHRRGELVDFGTLFEGFDYFGPSLVATLLHMLPFFIIVFPSYLIFLFGFFAVMPQGPDGGPPDPARVAGFFGIFWMLMAGIMLLVLVISVLFMFAYPLIVDRRLSGVEAVKLSVRAGLANFWRLLGLFFLTGVLALLGALACYVGMFLVLPISFAGIARAYEQVFGLANIPSGYPAPPPPPSFR